MKSDTLLLPLNGHLDGTSGGAGLTRALCTGKPKRRAPDIRRQHGSLTSKPENKSPQALSGEPRARRHRCRRRHGAATMSAPPRRSAAAGIGQRQPRERRRPCARHGQSRSSRTVPGTRTNAIALVANAIARREAAGGRKRSCGPRQPDARDWAIAQATNYSARPRSGRPLIGEAIVREGCAGRGGDLSAGGAGFDACFHAIGQARARRRPARECICRTRSGAWWLAPRLPRVAGLSSRRGRDPSPNKSRDRLALLDPAGCSSLIAPRQVA